MTAAELLQSVGLPVFKDTSDMTNDELDAEVFVGQKICKDAHDDHDHEKGENPSNEKIDDV